MKRPIHIENEPRGRFLLSFMIVGCLLSVWHAKSWAEVVTSILPDTTLPGGQNSVVAPVIEPSGTRFDITGGHTQGSSLFHSFSDFQVGVGDTGNFYSQGAANILSRVTGTNPSHLFGTLGVDVHLPAVQQSNANLFFLNPNGIVFGPQGSLNIGGSFYVTTADFISLGEGEGRGIFSSNESQIGSMFTAAPPSAFGFLSGNPASIFIDAGATLNMANSATLGIVGGDIDIGDRTINARSGNIILTSLASNGEVSSAIQGGAAFSEGTSGVTDWGTITFDSTFLRVSGKLNLSDLEDPTTRGGTIIIRGGQLVLDNNSQIRSDTVGNLDGAPVAIDIKVQDDVMLSGHSAITARSAGALDQSNVFLGDAGDILIEGRQIDILGGSTLNAIVQGGGDGSDILVQAQGLRLGGGSFINSQLSSVYQGQGGSIDLDIAGSFIIDAGSQIKSENLNSPASASDIHIRAHQFSINATGTETGIVGITGGSGRAVNVVLDVQNLSLTGDGARINTRSIPTNISGIPPKSGGGVILIQGINGPGSVADSVILDGVGAGLITETAGDGTGGDLSIHARQVAVNNRARLSASSGGVGDAGLITLNLNALELTGGARIDSSTTATGAGGTVTIQGLTGDGSDASMVVINGQDQNGLSSGIFTTASGDGGGGNILVHSDTVQLGTSGTVSSSSEGQGNSGKVEFQVNNNFLSDGGRVNTSAAQSTGGDIVVHSQGGIDLQNGSIISALSSGSDANIANGGTIFLEGLDHVQLSEGSSVTAASTGVGDAGNVTVIGGAFVGVDASTVSTTAQSGNGGNITVTSQDTIALTNGANISAESFGAGDAGSVSIIAPTIMVSGSLVTTAAAEAAGGDILLDGFRTVSLNNGTQVSALSSGLDASKASGGNITLRSGRNVALANSSKVTAESSGAGNAGRIALLAENTIRVRNSSITTEALQANGGNIELKTKKLIQVQDSQIISSVKGDKDTGGGDIFLDPDFIVLQNSQILARAFEGNGGNINLVANVIFGDLFTIIDATSDLGISGSVDIQAPIQNLSGTIAPLPETPANIGTMYSAKCAARKNGEFSSFAVVDRSGLPQVPGGWLSSPIFPLLASHPAADTQMAEATRSASKHHLSSHEPKRFKSHQFIGC